MHRVAHGAIGDPRPEEVVGVAASGANAVGGIANVKIGVTKLRRETEEERLVAHGGSLGDEVTVVEHVKGVALLDVAEAVDGIDLDPVLIAQALIACAIVMAVLTRGLAAGCL